jgi:hypothetical protein
VKDKAFKVPLLVAALCGIGGVTRRSLQPRPFLNLAVHARCGVPVAFLSRGRNA